MVEKEVEEATIKDLMEYAAIALENITDELATLTNEIVLLRAAWQSLKPAPVEIKAEEEEG